MVIGRGVVGLALKACSDDVNLISHETYLSNTMQVKDYEIVVNCAAIAGAGACSERSWQEVVEANVEFALTVQRWARLYNVPDVQLSTAGVSRKQTDPDGEKYMTENDPVYPHNVYTASMILKEQLLAPHVTTYVFRIGNFGDEEHWFRKSVNWSHVQDTYCSFTSPQTLRDAIIRVVMNEGKQGGIFNIVDKHKYLPDYINNLRKRKMTGDLTALTIRSDVPEGMTSAVMLCRHKASEHGLLVDYEV